MIKSSTKICTFFTQICNIFYRKMSEQPLLSRKIEEKANFIPQLPTWLASLRTIGKQQKKEKIFPNIFPGNSVANFKATLPSINFNRISK